MKKKTSKNIIRSTEHFLRDANTGKKSTVADILSEYRIALQVCIDYIWTTPIYLKNKLVFDVSKDLLDLPLFIDYKLIPIKTKLSARALQLAVEQAVKIVRSQITIRKNLLWQRSKIVEAGKDTDRIDTKLAKKSLTRPIVGATIGMELSAKCVEFIPIEKDGHFDFFIKLFSTGFDHIYIPVKLHKIDRKFINKKFKSRTGICLNNDKIILRYEGAAVEIKANGKEVGADTGIKSTVVFSDGQEPPMTDIHGHSLSSILHKMEGQEKNSKAIKRSQAHRKNFVNWSVNQLNLVDIKIINLEEINTFNGGSKSRYLSHFAHSLTQSKIIRLAEESGVQIVLKDCIYKSQRCSCCGIVKKKNRKGKKYHCSNCELQIDADLNSALNNAIDLPNIPFWLIASKLNHREGFLWKPEGLFDLEGQERLSESSIREKNIVPDADKKESELPAPMARDKTTQSS